MPTQFHVPVQPGGAEEINAVVARVRERGQVAYFASGVPVFVHADGDPVGQRIAAVQMMALGLARPAELSAAFGVHRSTLYRQGRKPATAGGLGVVDGKRGPRGPHRFTPDKWQRVTQWLGEGVSIRQAAQQVGVTEGTIRYALRRGAVRPAVATRPVGRLDGPRVRSERDAGAPGGVAVQRHGERALARLGLLTEAAPQFVAAEAVRYGRGPLFPPALLTLGVLEAGEQTYGALKNAFYGLRAALVGLGFLALLRARAPAQPPGG